MSDSRQTADNIKYAKDLMRILDFIRLNADLFTGGIYVWSNEITASFYGENAKETLIAAMRTIKARFKVTQITKRYDSGVFQMAMEIPETYIRFDLSTARTNVCTKVITGTETVEIPDYSQAPKKTVTRDTVEWQCDPILDAS